MAQATLASIQASSNNKQFNPKPRRAALVKVDGLYGHWAQMTGGNITADSTKVWDGGRLQPGTLSGPAQAANITLTRPYDVDRDHPVFIFLADKVGQWRTNVWFIPTDLSLTALNRKAIHYPKALLVGLTWPEWDASSADAATCSLEFSVSTWTAQ